MLESPFGSRGGHGQRTTPSKERLTMSPAFGNEENQENSIVPAGQGPPKRAKFETSIQRRMSSQQQKPSNTLDGGSDCGTEVSSTVSARRAWLKEFGRQHENRNPKSATKTIEHSKTAAKVAPLGSATKMSRRVSSSNPAFAASALVNKLVSEPKKFSTPVRMKPRHKKEGVQATNEGYASVAKLSEWLANDPTSTKKKRHVRRGKNVITKSRQFEKGLEDVIVIENNISRGAVSDRKKWLKGAFHEQEGSDADVPQVTRYAKSEAAGFDNASSISVSDKKDWLKHAFKKGAALDSEGEASPAEESRCEIITDDAASSLSVSDKKDWLKNAFKKAEGHKQLYSKAKSDILHPRGENRNEAAARAKRKFLERSGRMNARTPPKTQSPGLHGRAPPVTETTPSQTSRGEDFRTPSREQPHSCDRKDTTEQRIAPPVIEDTTPVDFRNARNFLIQNSKKNGHDAQVVNAVFLKKNKFERMEKEMRRRSGPNGLLKASWAQTESRMGRPSHGAYEKTYVSDIAPKKSFEELP